MEFVYISSSEILLWSPGRSLIHYLTTACHWNVNFFSSYRLHLGLENDFYVGNDWGCLNQIHQHLHIKPLFIAASHRNVWIIFHHIKVKVCFKFEAANSNPYIFYSHLINAIIFVYCTSISTLEILLLLLLVQVVSLLIIFIKLNLN